MSSLFEFHITWLSILNLLGADNFALIKKKKKKLIFSPIFRPLDSAVQGGRPTCSLLATFLI
jgi:uncharacterized membrane protein